MSHKLNSDNQARQHDSADNEDSPENANGIYHYAQRSLPAGALSPNLSRCSLVPVPRLLLRTSEPLTSASHFAKFVNVTPLLKLLLSHDRTQRNTNIKSMKRSVHANTTEEGYRTGRTHQTLAIIFSQIAGGVSQIYDAISLGTTLAPGRSCGYGTG